MLSEERLQKIVGDITDNYTNEELFYIKEGHHMPDRNQIIHIIMGLRQIMFPGYFEKEHLGQTVPEYFVGHSLIRIHDTLSGQILSAFQQADAQASTSDLTVRVEGICDRFFASLAQVQKTLMKDVQAAFDGDPAAKTKEEIIFCYPGLLAIFIYRIAHELYENKVAMIPRMMSEYAHSQTGIDINPGATIGEYFFIDHGTGVVVGETTIIGDNVKLYQGATLGALSPAGMATNPNVRRHPKVGNNVVIYANSTLLGGATEIGDNVVVGGNAFLTSSVAPNTVVSVKNPEMTFRGKHHRG